jgi:hypothetical protein
MLLAEGCAIPRCHAALLLIHRLWWKKVCYPCAAMQVAAVVINALVEGCAILPAAMLAAVVIHRMLWWKKGVLSLRCHASSLLL